MNRSGHAADYHAAGLKDMQHGGRVLQTCISSFWGSHLTCGKQATWSSSLAIPDAILPDSGQILARSATLSGDKSPDSAYHLTCNRGRSGQRDAANMCKQLLGHSPDVWQERPAGHPAWPSQPSARQLPCLGAGTACTSPGQLRAGNACRPAVHGDAATIFISFFFYFF